MRVGIFPDNVYVFGSKWLYIHDFSVCNDAFDFFLTVTTFFSLCVMLVILINCVFMAINKEFAYVELVLDSSGIDVSTNLLLKHKSLLVFTRII